MPPRPLPVPPKSCSTNLRMQYQEMYEWCWIAVATSINLYYNLNSLWTQCSLATKVLTVNSGLQVACCPTGGPTPDPYLPSSLYALESQVPMQCNHSGGVNDALRFAGNSAGFAPAPLPLGPTEPVTVTVFSEICAGRPLAVGINWNSGGGHVVAIAALQGSVIHVLDPIYGETDIFIELFPSQYQGGATWAGTDLTQA